MTTTKSATSAPTKPKSTDLDPQKAVKTYLRSLKISKRTGPGRPRTDAAIQRRIDDAKRSIEFHQRNGSVLNELTSTQRLLDAQADMREYRKALTQDPSNFEGDFVKVLPEYSKRKGISSAAWRKVGVPANVIKKAGL